MSEYVSVRGRDALRKAEHFGKFAKAYGWSGKWSKDSDTGIVHLFCRRGENETIDIWWQANGCIEAHMMPVYTLAGERIKCHNVSAAAKIAQNPPNHDRLKKAVRKRKRQTGIEYSDPAALVAVQGPLPFDHESDDAELEAVLHKRTITWVNSISGELDSAFVDADKQFQVIRKNGSEACRGDQIGFCDPTAGGYRAVYLNAIVSVG